MAAEEGARVASPGALPTPVTPVAWLRTALEQPDPAARPAVLDVRWRLRPPPRTPKEVRAAAREDPPGLVEYDAGHLPGAVFVDLDTELAGPPGPAGRHPLPDPDVLEETLRRAGVTRSRSVVAYDGGDGLAAARAWWVLRWAGLAPERVAVLDGGFPAWVAEGGEVTTAPPGVRAPGDVGVGGGAMPVLSADAAASLADDPAAVLVDGRAGERFRGETEPLEPVAGHVPGAANLPASSLLDVDGRWRAPDELAAALGDVLPDTAAPVGAYCGSGVSATMLVLALERSGLRPPSDPAGLYVGSWSHWCAAKRPVEAGPAR
jgi:thiosulfate/3-mercaptopyruvate sulfurtransferase